MDVVLLFEKASREIEVATALEYILSRRHGLTTEIVQQNYPRPGVLRDLNPSIVVLPFCYQERSNNEYLVRWRNATFFNLTWEQLFYPGNSKAKTPRGTFAIRHVVHNAWSQAYVDLLRAQGVPDRHIFLSGNPAYSLYDEPYRRYFKTRSELASTYGLDEARRWVFFPENYNWAFYEQPMLDQMVRDGQPVSQVLEMRGAVTRSFEQTMRWCAAVARTGNVELIVRPRPSTPSAIFANRVREVVGHLPSGMAIIDDETVRDWILASDVILSSYSTSLIEASIAGKPAYIVEPTPWPEELHQPWHDLTPRIATEEGFIEVAAHNADAGAATSLRTWARESMMARGDSILLIADQIAAMHAGDVARPGPAPWQAVTIPSRWPLPRKAVYEYRRRVRPHLRLPNKDIEAEYRPDVEAAACISGFLRRWQPILGPYVASIEDQG